MSYFPLIQLTLSEDSDEAAVKLIRVEVRGAGVYGHGQGEADGCGVAVAYQLRAQVLQGEGGVAVAARGAPQPWGGALGERALPNLRAKW